MSDIINILKCKKLQLIFLFYTLLLLPILSPIAQNISITDKCAIIGCSVLLFLAISILSLFISSRTEKIIYSVLLIISIIPGAIYLAYLLFAHVLLEQNSVTSLFETNPEESKEFIAYYMSFWVTIGVLLYVAIPVIMIYKMKSLKPLKIKSYPILFSTCLLFIIATFTVNQLSKHIYFINFYRTFINYKVRLHHEISSIEARQTLPLDIKVEHQDSIPQTIVVVIGESLNKHHMSLYGYQRNTNPRLSMYDKEHLIVYNDIVSPQVHTIPVLRSLFTLIDKDHPDNFTEYPSLFELFNRIGYDTYFISNQGFNKDCRSSYDVLFNLAKYKYNHAPKKAHDEIVLKTFDHIVSNNENQSKIIVIHLIGNHMAYEFRYPDAYNIFDYKKDNAIQNEPYRDNNAKKVIDKYDNSVVYNDFVIDSIVKSLNKIKNQNTLMVYLSDHAEELYDYREFAGHAYEKVSPTMAEIPLIVWMSDSYKQSRPDLVLDCNRPYSSGDFLYSLSDLAGIKYNGYDDTRSLFSRNFQVRERFVGDINYKDLKAKYKISGK